MEKFITATGKTIDLAIANALEQLGMDRDSVSVEVLDNPKSGFLGFGAQPAKVKVTYEVPDVEEAPRPALSSASRSKPKKTVQAQEDAPRVIAPAAPAAPRPQPMSPLDTAERAARPERRPRNERRNDQPRRQRSEQPRREQPAAPAAPAEPKVYAPAEPGSTEERIEIFIKGLLEHMGSDAVPHAVKNADDTYMVDLVGENLGILIGRKNAENGDGVCDGCGREMSRFSVTVPASLTVTVSEHGVVYTATGAGIVNNSSSAVQVSGVTLRAENGWTIVPYTTNMAAQKVDSKRIGFALGGIQTAATGKSEQLTASSMTVSAGATLPLSYDAVVSASSAAINEQVLTIVFVVGWA